MDLININNSSSNITKKFTIEKMISEVEIEISRITDNQKQRENIINNNIDEINNNIFEYPVKIPAIVRKSSKLGQFSQKIKSNIINKLNNREIDSFKNNINRITKPS